MRTLRKQNFLWPALLALSLVTLQSCSSSTTETTKSEEKTTESALASSPCTLPSQMAASNDETAWQLFVAANCMVNGQLTWTTWTEQTCWVAPSTPGCGGNVGAKPTRRFRGSRLARVLRANQQNLPNECNPMTTTGQFAPKNLAKNPVFCEEVYVNGAESSFITQPAAGQTLTTVAGQVAYAGTAGGVIDFPMVGVEVKADWIPASSLAQPFDCANNKPAGVYVETIDSTCYALVGLHISSKLLQDWLWATFEPQNTDTNPNRCNPNLYNSCNDAWGSNPAVSTGQSTAQTAALAALMKAANLPAEFSNYRLTGAQSAFVDGSNQPVQLGNSFVEFNAGVPAHQASCMTCHSSAMIVAGAQKPCCLVAIGNPPAPPANSISQDFSWLLGIMPAK